MTGPDRLLAPRSIAIAGISADPDKHGRRVLDHLRRLGYQGEVWGVNPRLPAVGGVEVYPGVAELPASPDVVVAAVPAPAVVDVVADSKGAGAVVVFAAGFAESGPQGAARQRQLVDTAAAVGVRLLGPNSGGVIRPALGLAASFLTCLDRPPSDIRSGPVAVVTQSGGIGSYLHNLAAGRGEGLALSLSTGNEADIDMGEAIDAVSALDEVEAVVAIIETLRKGPSFLRAVRRAGSRGKRVIACRLGRGVRGGSLTTTHTGAMATRSGVIDGFLYSAGVATAETPGEAYEVATVLARLTRRSASRAGVVTHSGGTAILLADLAERGGVALPEPSETLRQEVASLLDHGTAGNPLDMGGIIGGPSRFAEVVGRFARSGEFDVILAVSTAHPPAHTAERAESLLALETDVPVVHLWMAGDQAATGLARLHRAGSAATEEPRAAIRVLAALAAEMTGTPTTEPFTGPPESWGLPLDPGLVVTSPQEAVQAAAALGYPVAVKAVAPGLVHKTDMGGVALDLRNAAELGEACMAVLEAAAASGRPKAQIRVQRYRPGLEMIVGGLTDPALGSVVSVGMGGVLTEAMEDVVFSPAPVEERAARSMIDRLRGRRLLDGYRGAPPSDVAALAAVVSRLSRGLVGSRLDEVEVNPLIWDGTSWVGVDWRWSDR